jgi:hypothetical protein
MSQMAMQTSQYGNQAGGAISPVDRLLQQLDSTPRLVFGILMLVLIAFVDQLSPTLSRYADTALGRVVCIGVIAGVLYTMGPIYGLLTAAVLLLLIHSAPRLTDGFTSQKDQKIQGSLWFVEQVLGERPDRIIDDLVNTEAVQDDSDTLMKHSGSGK